MPAKLLQLCPTLCDPMDYIAGQAPPSVGFFRQEYWTGLPFPTPGDLPNPGIEAAFPALTGRLFTTEPPGRPPKGTERKLKITHFFVA